MVFKGWHVCVNSFTIVSDYQLKDNILLFFKPNYSYPFLVVFVVFIKTVLIVRCLFH